MSSVLDNRDRARNILVRAIDIFDDHDFGRGSEFTFGDLRQLINFVERAVEALGDG